MLERAKIEIIITGGTIDSFYDGIKDTVVPSKTSSIPDFIKSLKLEDEFSFKEVCMKDSRSLSSNDLDSIVAFVENSEAQHVIITHGTYTMPDTARLLEAKLKRKDQIIILTGSMIPLVGFSPSDAPFNLGFSIASLKTTTPGIYVCMNGQIFTATEVTKRISEGRFVSVFNKN